MNAFSEDMSIMLVPVVWFWLACGESDGLAAAEPNEGSLEDDRLERVIRLLLESLKDGS